MSMSRKAEASVEFMVFFGIILLFFVFFLGVIGSNNNDVTVSTVFASANNVLNTVVNEINTAARIDGYHRNFFIPNSLSDGESYSVTYNTSLRMVSVVWGSNKIVTGNIITSNVTGNISTGYNSVGSVGGLVMINEG